MKLDGFNAQPFLSALILINIIALSLSIYDMLKTNLSFLDYPCELT